MVHITPGEVAHHLLRFLIESITGRRIRREDGDGGDVTHRGNTGDVNLAGMSAGIEKIIFVLLAGSDVTCQGIGRAIARGGAALLSATSQSGSRQNRKRD